MRTFHAKSTLAFVAALIMAALLLACGNGGSSTTTTPPPTTPPPTTPPPATPPPSSATFTEIAYVANAGGGISAFGIDSTTGALTAVTGSPFIASTPVTDLTVEPGGRVIYAATTAAAAANIQTFAVTLQTGVLTPLSTSSFGRVPGRIALDPSGRFAYIIPAASAGVGEVSAFSVDLTTRTLTPLAGQPTAVAGVPQSIAVDPTGKFVYMPFAGTGPVPFAVAGRSRDATTGLLTTLPDSPYALSGTGARDIAITPSGNLVFVANNTSNNVSVLSLNSTTGTLTPVTGSPVTVGTGPVAIAVDPSGKFVFVANQTSNNLSVFSISPPSTLVPVAGSPFATGVSPTAVAVDPDGKFVYVASNNASNTVAGAVSAFALNATTGALTPVAGSPFATGNGPADIVVARPQ